MTTAFAMQAAEGGCLLKPSAYHRILRLEPDSFGEAERR
jgi:hypothetical protein